ncbi:hypothetical protein Mettu_0312 [Methylobacter tundripaludum SV96]|uniref:Uncharacterized protein n=1 Tax=Methylobacter tundripaludum (strain ATCC BAA-1195 / DSM 17260 / SV96) TaxID=697282 RepID=G3IUD6_METTV|nr:hypothetical protein Mettu_0312 [Methylobacter tundripaludum SV96]
MKSTKEISILLFTLWMSDGLRFGIYWKTFVLFVSPTFGFRFSRFMEKFGHVTMIQFLFLA